MWDYTDKVRDHYLHPRNVGEIVKPDGIGEVGNITCGDALRLTFKLGADGKIAEAKFKTFGCGSAIATASVLTELVRGKTLDEAQTITNHQIAEELGGLPREKMHCSVMGQEALEAAISYYRSGGKAPAVAHKHGKVVCVCFNVTEEEIVKAIKENNLTTLQDVTNFTKAGGACGKCHSDIQHLIDRVMKKGASESADQPATTGRMTTLQKIDRIRTVLEQEVRPILAGDGGDCELVDVDGNVVYIKFKGHCRGCAFSAMTLLGVVEKNLKEKVLADLVVKEA